MTDPLRWQPDEPALDFNSWLALAGIDWQAELRAGRLGVLFRLWQRGLPPPEPEPDRVQCDDC